MDQEHGPEPLQVGHDGAAVDPEMAGGRRDVDLGRRGRRCPSEKEGNAALRRMSASSNRSRRVTVSM